MARDEKMTAEKYTAARKAFVQALADNADFLQIRALNMTEDDILNRADAIFERFERGEDVMPADIELCEQAIEICERARAKLEGAIRARENLR
jgi:hypothetical protein